MFGYWSGGTDADPGTVDAHTRLVALLKSPHKRPVHPGLYEKRRSASERKGPPPVQAGAGAVTHVKRAASRWLEGGKMIARGRGAQILQENPPLENRVIGHPRKGSRPEVRALASAEELGMFVGIEGVLNEEASCGTGFQARLSKKIRR